MLLAIDMGNTQTEVGLMEGDRLVVTERLSTDLKKTSFEYAVFLHNIFEMCRVDTKKITGAIISSVVPPLTIVLKEAVKKAVGLMPMVVGPGVKNGLKIKIDDPKQLGADMVVDAVGGLELYGAPLIIIDLGTATTISALDAGGCFIGGMIVPGVMLSVNALVSGTSQLPKIDLVAPRKAVGANTVDCMKSGVIFGQAAQLDGLVKRIRRELEAEAKVIATGGLSSVVVPYCETEITIDRELMIKGLKAIYDRNAVYDKNASK